MMMLVSMIFNKVEHLFYLLSIVSFILNQSISSSSITKYRNNRRRIPSSASKLINSDLFKVELNKKLTGGDQCQFLTSEQVHPYDEIINCFNSIKLNQARKNLTIDIMKKTLPFYIFNDLVKDPSLSYSTIDENWDLPLALQANYNNNEIILQVVPVTVFNNELLKKSESILGVNLRDYAGYKVKKINDMDPIKGLDIMSRSLVGISKDPSARFNNMLLSPSVVDGTPNLLWGSFAAPPNLPNQSSVSITLESPDSKVISLNLPYLTYGTVGFRDGIKFFSKQCLISSKELSASNEPNNNNEQELLLNNNNNINNNTLEFSNNLIPITKSSWLTTFILNNHNNKTGVMTYPTNVASTVQELDEFLLTFYLALLKLKAQGVDNIILDVSHNTGGPICASNALLEYFLEADKLNKYTTNLRYHPLSEALAVNAAKYDPHYRIWGPNSWLFSNNQKQVNDISWLVPPVKDSFRKDQLLSQPISDKCPPNVLTDKLKLFPVQNLAIISNGICLSSCSTLVDGLINANVSIHITDGLLNLDPSPHNMQGGQLYTYDKLYSDLIKLNVVNHPEAPAGPLPLRSVFGFTLREMYFNHNQVPMEYDHPKFNIKRYYYQSNSNDNKEFNIKPLDYYWNQVAQAMTF